jgi:integrase/recombinase XerD
MSAFDIQKTLNRNKKISNKNLSRIGRELGFPVHLCLNLAHHSFATKMKIDNVSLVVISDAMGYTTMLITEHYMKSLPNENLKVMSANLLSSQFTILC